MPEVSLRTSVWYGNSLLHLPFPSDWDVEVLWPNTPAPLTDEQISRPLREPVGRPPFAEICRGVSCPLVIIDDLNRPTPVFRVMPLLLQYFQQAGVPPAQVTVLSAGGMHAPSKAGISSKIGREAASACRVLVHDPNGALVKIGRTSFGTPVFVNKAVIDADLVIGIGGVYPNYTAGFGGGSKLALGVLGSRSIMHLHFRHKGAGWGAEAACGSFRRDLDEIANLIRLRTMICLHVNANQEVVRVACGDPQCFYKAEVAFAKESFRAPPPEGANVVIANAYPNDISLTFAHKKGTAPLRRCGSGVSRVVIASCSEGVGHHALFPFINQGRLFRPRQLLRRASVLSPRELAGRIQFRLRQALHRRQQPGPPKQNRIWLYRPGHHTESLPAQIPGMTLAASWPEIIEAVRREQAGKEPLRVLIYPCSPLQWMDWAQARGSESSVRATN